MEVVVVAGAVEEPAAPALSISGTPDELEALKNAVEAALSESRGWKVKAIGGFTVDVKRCTG